MRNSKKAFAIAAATWIAVCAQGQPATPAPKAPNQVPTSPASAPPGRPAPRFDHAGLDLTPELRAKIDEVNKTYSAKATPLYAKLATARHELEGFVNQDKVDEVALRAKTKEMADLEGEIAIARAVRYASFRGFLTPEQARRFNEPAPITRPFQPTLHEGQTPPPVAPNK